MKNKKIIMYISIILLIIIISIVGYLLSYKNNEEIFSDYTPAQEITDEQLRKTNIVLYFYDEINDKIIEEIKQIDAKILLENPEKKLIEYLISGPQNNNINNLIPENTQIINIEIKKGILYINFSKEFIGINNLENKIKEKINETILKTVVQLNEINQIKILVEGGEME